MRSITCECGRQINECGRQIKPAKAVRKKNVSFHKMVQYAVRMRGKSHWFLEYDDPALISDPLHVAAPTISMRNALYALMRAPVPRHQSARPTCGMRLCVNPQCQELTTSWRSTPSINFAPHIVRYREYGFQITESGVWAPGESPEESPE